MSHADYLSSKVALHFNVNFWRPFWVVSCLEAALSTASAAPVVRTDRKTHRHTPRKTIPGFASTVGEHVIIIVSKNRRRSPSQRRQYCRTPWKTARVSETDEQLVAESCKCWVMIGRMMLIRLRSPASALETQRTPCRSSWSQTAVGRDLPEYTATSPGPHRDICRPHAAEFIFTSGVQNSLASNELHASSSTSLTDCNAP